jgi:DNA primase
VRLLERFDFREYIEENFGARPKGYNRHEVSIDCINPGCDDNWRRKKHMTVNVEKGLAYCFKCQESYDVVRFIMTFEEIPYGQAMQKVFNSIPKRSYGPGRLEKAIKELVEGKKEEEPEEKKPLTLPITVPITAGHPAYEYLAGRRFGEDVIRQFALRFCPAGPFAGRVVIPVYSGGRLVAYQGRTIYGANPKYLFPEGGDFANYLYNYDDAMYFGTVILVEGVTDCWRVWSRGYHNVAATFGKALKPKQRQALTGNDRIREVVLFWDGNAVKEAYRAALELIEFKRVRVVELPHEMEPDTCPDIGDRLESAVRCGEMSMVELKLKAVM